MTRAPPAVNPPPQPELLGPAVLPVMVELVNVAAPVERKPPPSQPAVLDDMVELIRIISAEVSIPPPESQKTDGIASNGGGV